MRRSPPAPSLSVLSGMGLLVAAWLRLQAGLGFLLEMSTIPIKEFLGFPPMILLRFYYDFKRILLGRLDCAGLGLDLARVSYGFD